jgi:hypothetical protein
MCSLSGVSFFLCFPSVLLTLQADGRDDGGPGLPIGQTISGVKRVRNNDGHRAGGAKSIGGTGPELVGQEAAAQNNGGHRADGAKPISEAGLELVEQNNAAQNNNGHRAGGAKPISEAGLPIVQKNSAIVPIRERSY